jgi:hypothetical protein
VLYQQAPLDLDFAGQARLENRESRLPQEVREHREPYGFIGRDCLRSVPRNVWASD